MYINRLNEFANDDAQVMKWLLMDNNSGLLNFSETKQDALRNEKDYQAASWKKHQDVKHTSKYKESPAYSKQLSIKAFKDLSQHIKKFQKFVGKKIYGYQMVINPQKLGYKKANQLNNKIMHQLAKNPKIAIINASLEHTYQNTYINVHWQYLIVSTVRINKRKTYRKCASIASKFTHSPVNAEYKYHQQGKPFEQVTDWKKAISYETKEQGLLPLMLLHNQHERMIKTMPLFKILYLIAKDLKDGKGKIRNRLYDNIRNPYVKAWKKYLKAKKKNKSYCIRHNVLVDPKQYYNDEDFYINEHSTVFPDEDYFKLNPHARIRNSKHHGTTNETYKLYKYGNRYANPKPLNIRQLSLFNRSVVTV